MKVVVPYVPGRWPLNATRLALLQDGHDPEFHNMQTNESYFELLSGLWAKRETFVTVEHDIVVWPGGIDELYLCREPWCVLPYYCSVGWIVDGLGCTKFSAAFMEKYPEFFQPPFPACCSHTTHYCGLDRLIACRMKELGIESHQHAPGVVNLNEKWTV